jgi:hypothetical protein
MNENVTKQEILVFVAIFALMLGTLIYGFFFTGVGQIDNCWDNYKTEQEAIMACEGTNE